MAASLVQPSFSSGEVCPGLYARTDLAAYRSALSLCQNFIPKPAGGVENRAGTQFVAPLKDETKRAKLVPFLFNTQQTYMLEFGEGYMRVIANGGLVTETERVVNNITNAVFAVVNVTAHGYSVGDTVYFGGILGMTEINGLTAKVRSIVNADSFTIFLDTNNFHEFSGSTGGVTTQPGDPATGGTGGTDIPPGGQDTGGGGIGPGGTGYYGGGTPPPVSRPGTGFNTVLD